MEFFSVLMVLTLLFMVFGVAIPHAFTAPIPDQVEFIVENWEWSGNGLPEKLYVKDYKVLDNGVLRLCGYWDPPDHFCWDTGYDWVPDIVTLPQGTYKIDRYPIVKPAKEYCPEPK